TSLQALPNGVLEIRDFTHKTTLKIDVKTGKVISGTLTRECASYLVHAALDWTAAHHGAVPYAGSNAATFGLGAAGAVILGGAAIAAMFVTAPITISAAIVV